MRTPTLRFIFCQPILLVGLACGSTPIELPESTTIEMCPSGGVAKSADGVFEVHFAQDVTMECIDVTIVTRRDLSVSGAPEGLLFYEVQPIDLELDKVELSYRLPDGFDWEGRLALARVEKQTPSALDASALNAEGTALEAAVGQLSCYNLLGCPHVFGPIVQGQLSCSGDPCQACTSCDDSDPACHAGSPVFCTELGACTPTLPDSCVLGGELEGWDDAPATGQVYVFDTFGIAGRGQGFDLDGTCSTEDGCIDNVLWELNVFWNDQIRQGLLGGALIQLIELAGLDDPFTGNDRSLTMKLYRGRDADDPFFPANNFQIPVGDSDCCEFLVEPSSLSGVPPQARARAVGRIDRAQLRSLSPMAHELDLDADYSEEPPASFRIERLLVTAQIESDGTRLLDGLIGGAIPIHALASRVNEYCAAGGAICPVRAAGATYLDAVSWRASPDIDLDVPPDGLEQVRLGTSGRIETCIDGDGSIVPPIRPDEPWSCAERPQMADGFSVAFFFTAVRASVVGTAN